MAVADEDEKWPTPDVPTKVWEVGVGLVFVELQRSFLTFTDSASPIPETTSPLAEFRSPLIARGMGGRSWDETLAAFDIPCMAFLTWRVPRHLCSLRGMFPCMSRRLSTITLHYIIFYYITLHYTALQYTTLHHNTLHYVVVWRVFALGKHWVLGCN